MTKVDPELLKRMHDAREILLEFGLRLCGFDPGVTAFEDQRSGSLSFEKREWAWLEPLLIELRDLRKDRLERIAEIVEVPDP